MIDGTHGIIAGHGRVEAAKLAGMNDVPTVCVDYLTPAQIRELLTLELQELSVKLNFDVTVTGFETAEIDLLIGELNEDDADDAYELLNVPVGRGVDRSEHGI